MKRLRRTYCIAALGALAVMAAALARAEMVSYHTARSRRMAGLMNAFPAMTGKRQNTSPSARSSAIIRAATLC